MIFVSKKPINILANVGPRGVSARGPDTKSFLTDILLLNICFQLFSATLSNLYASQKTLCPKISFLSKYNECVQEFTHPWSDSKTA